MQSVKLRRRRSQIGSLQSFRRQHWGGSDSCAHFAFCICFHLQLDFSSYFVKSFFLICVSLFSDVERAGAFREVSNGSGQLECHSWPIVSTPHHLFTLNSPQFILKRHYYIWRGTITTTITIGEAHSIPCLTPFNSSQHKSFFDDHPKEAHNYIFSHWTLHNSYHREVPTLHHWHNIF